MIIRLKDNQPIVISRDLTQFLISLYLFLFKKVYQSSDKDIITLAKFNSKCLNDSTVAKRIRHLLWCLKSSVVVQTRYLKTVFSLFKNKWCILLGIKLLLCALAFECVVVLQTPYHHHHCTINMIVQPRLLKQK